MLEGETVEVAMRRALSLARRGPADDLNPQVGCVLLDAAGIPVAEGWHRGAGTPHAEVDALSRLPEQWRGRERELTAIVTLEPCNHTGRTGPCAVALAEAGIGAVVYALNDPGAAAGGGAETLRDAGVNVLGGVLADEARELLTPWLTRQATAPGIARAPHIAERTPNSGGKTGAFGNMGCSDEGEDGSGSSDLDESGSDGSNGNDGNGNETLRNGAAPFGEIRPRPHVTVKWAQTLDGRAAATDGSSQWITGADARGDVHRRRAEADAILVGTGTLYADDPALTARAETGGLLVPANEQPVPVVLGKREIPLGSGVLQHPALEAHGLQAPLRFDGSDLPAHLEQLHEQGVRRLFVEGGPTVASALIREGLVDEVLVYIAPALLGGPKLALGDLGIENMQGIKRLRITHFAQLGADLLIKASLESATVGSTGASCDCTQDATGDQATTTPQGEGKEQ